MKIVIEIPEKTYQKIIAGTYDYGDMNVIIQNGTQYDGRPHGEWIRYTEDGFDYAKCSACKWDSGEAFEYAIDRFPFCPNCGSDNRKRGDEK